MNVLDRLTGRPALVETLMQARDRAELDVLKLEAQLATARTVHADIVHALTALGQDPRQPSMQECEDDRPGAVDWRAVIAECDATESATDPIIAIGHTRRTIVDTTNGSTL